MTYNMADSILSSIKQAMPNSGVPEDYTVFDNEIIMDINMVLATLKQLGVGPVDQTFQISGTGETWGDFLDDDELLALVPSYIAIKVRMLFDPVKSSIVKEQLDNFAKELEFRINDVCRRYHKRKEDIL